MDNGALPLAADSSRRAQGTPKGLYSRIKRDVKVRDHRVRYLVWRLRKMCPWIGESDLPAARSWAQLSILAEVAYARLRDEGMATPSGEPKRLVAEFRALKAAELAYARELGLTPSARRQLSVSGKMTDLAELLAAHSVSDEQDGNGERSE